MTGRTAAIASRLAGALEGPPSAVPLLTGGCGAGRTSVLLSLRERLGPARCQYVSVERTATTPERFLRALVEDSPFRGGPHTSPTNIRGPRHALDAGLAFLTSACTADGAPAVFLLDEVLDLRTFENFPGLRAVMRDLMDAIAGSPNRFVLATRFSARGARLAAGCGARVEPYPLPAMAPGEVLDALSLLPHDTWCGSVEDTARTVHALTEGRPAYVQAVLDEMTAMARHGGADPVGALVAALTDGGSLATRCRFSYELRLHRARGYGALKAILDVLAEDEPLTLTVIAQRLQRTPGSTKDYLGWLEDVDLIGAERKRYRFADAVLRLWVRLQARSLPCSEETVVREVQRYAMQRLAASRRAEPTRPPDVRPPEAEPVGAAASTGAGSSPPRPRDSGIIEFD